MMEAFAIIGALSGALSQLEFLGKLLTKLGKQFSSQESEISALQVRIVNISNELRVMDAFENQINMHNQRNEVVAAWTKVAINVQNQIEDTLEEYRNLVNDKKGGGSSFLVKWISNKPKSLLSLKTLSDRLDEVETRVKHLGEMKDRWSITNIRYTSSTTDANKISVQLATSAHFIDEREIVGIDETRPTLTRLINSGDSNCAVISVWGMPGVGKTTLVTSVFKREKEHFACHAWISISKNYELDQVLRNLISEICKKEHTNQTNTDTMNSQELKKTVCDLLQHKRYLIVLDDVWDKNFYEHIGDVFVDDHQGSRIVITTRNRNVASLSKMINTLNLEPLPPKESWNLFCRKAFPFERNSECPPDLVKWAEKIVSKCGGLPLALVSLGNVLSSCRTIESEWKRVYDQLSWELENNESLDRLKNVLNLSFDNLPKYLKDCFLYCCMFPEDFLFARKKLIRLWIAEDFVKERGRSTLEETAEGYLLELINHSMLQVAERNDSGRVKRCRMHDTLRELGISICMKQNFGFLYGENTTVEIDENVRRLSIIKSSNIGYDVNQPSLRTLMAFDNSMHLSPLVTADFLKKSKSLAVLNLENLGIQSVPSNIGDLVNLRYLGLRNTKVKLLPNSIYKLHNLQTLDLSLSEIQHLPDGISQLKRLRHLFAEVVTDNTYKSFQNRRAISLKKDIFRLKELQTIQAVESNAVIVRELGGLHQLRSLGIRNVNENQYVELCRSLSKMTFLHSLYIFASEENQILYLDHFQLQPQQQLQKLWLFGQLTDNILDSPIFQIASIQQLHLGWSELKDDPLPSLSHLKNLTSFFLTRAYSGRKISFRAGWFPKLKKLGLTNMPNLIGVDMEKGTMKSIETIVFRDLQNLVEFPRGVEHLISLKLMACENLSPKFGGLSKGVHNKGHFNCDIY